MVVDATYKCSSLYLCIGGASKLKIILLFSLLECGNFLIKLKIFTKLCEPHVIHATTTLYREISTSDFCIIYKNCNRKWGGGGDIDEGEMMSKTNVRFLVLITTYLYK